MADHEMYQYMKQGKTLTLTSLSAPGNSETVKVLGCGSFIYQYTIASIDTNVVVRAEGSLDESSWFNLDIDDQDSTQTADGTYSFKYTGEGELPYTRFKFVSETVLTAATIAIKISAGGDYHA